MSRPLTPDDIDKSIVSKIHLRSYARQKEIDGVKILTVENHVEEDGSFSEIIKTSNSGGILPLPQFKIAQLNRSTQHPGTIKAWHLQLEQDMLWYVAPHDDLFVGLWDIRKRSKTKGVTMRIVLGGGNSVLLYIPRGVAHGSTNVIKKSVDLYYFTNKQFSKSHPDERRIPWDTLGKEFWIPSRE